MFNQLALYFELSIEDFKGLTVMFNANTSKIYILYSNTSIPLDIANSFYSNRIGEFEYSTFQGLQNIIIEVVEESLSIVMVDTSSNIVKTAFTNFPLPGFPISVPADNRAFGLSSTTDASSTFNVYSLNYFELDCSPTTSSSTTSTSTSTSTTPATTEITTTIKPVTFTDEESYSLEYLGDIQVDGNLTLTNGSSLNSFPWPAELNDSNSNLYQEITGIFENLVRY